MPSVSSPWWACQLFIPSSHSPLLYFAFLILPYPLWFPHPTICLCVNTTASISLLKNHPSNSRWGLNRCLLWQLMVIVTLPMVCHIWSTRWQKQGSQSVRWLSRTSQATHEGSHVLQGILHTIPHVTTCVVPRSWGYPISYSCHLYLV